MAKEKSINELKDNYAKDLKRLKRSAKINDIRGNIKVDNSIKKAILDNYISDAERKALEIETTEVGGEEYIAEGGTMKLFDTKPKLYTDFVTELFKQVEAPTTPAGTGSTGDAGTGSSASLVGEPKSKNEAYELAEKKYSKLPENERTEKLIEMTKTDAYTKLPEFNL